MYRKILHIILISPDTELYLQLAWLLNFIIQSQGHMNVKFYVF